MRYSRPAVTIERSDATNPDTFTLRTDITGFIGIARRGPLDTPIPVESFRQYLSHFGDFSSGSYLPHAVSGFFANGGKRCWVVRVASRDPIGGAKAASIDIANGSGRLELRIEASSPGTWGNALSLEWQLEPAASVVSEPAGSSAQHACVASSAGFGSHDLVEIEQPGEPATLRVVAAVDARERRLYWIHPEHGARLPVHQPFEAVVPAQPLRIKRLAYRLIVREAGRVIAIYRDLQLYCGHPRWIGAILAAPDLRPLWLHGVPAARMRDLPRPPEPIVAIVEPTPGQIPAPLAITPGAELNLREGSDGVELLSDSDILGDLAAPGDCDELRRRKGRGLEALAECEEIGLLALPDIHLQPIPDPLYALVRQAVPDPCRPCPPSAPSRRIHQPMPSVEQTPGFSLTTIAKLQGALLDHCERLGDRFAVLSVPHSLAVDAGRSREDLLAWRDQFETRHGALYLPWVEVVDPADTGRTRWIPACGHVCGAMAHTDLTIGVHRAPANLPLVGVSNLSLTFADESQGLLNLAGLNLVREELGRPPILAGARTLSHDPDWRFINVVRLLLALKRAIDVTLRWTPFEPNTLGTQAAIRASLTAMLQAFFARGAFRGATEEESFFVRCDEATTTAIDRGEGRLIALVGVAPSIPCEFIVLRVGQERNTLTVALLEAEGSLA